MPAFGPESPARDAEAGIFRRWTGSRAADRFFLGMILRRDIIIPPLILLTMVT